MVRGYILLLLFCTILIYKTHSKVDLLLSNVTRESKIPDAAPARGKVKVARYQQPLCLNATNSTVLALN